MSPTSCRCSTPLANGRGRARFGQTVRRPRPARRARFDRMLRVGSIVIRVDDLPRQIAFWTAALDYVPREPHDDTFALLKPRDGVGPNVSLDHVRAAVPVPPKIHLDLYADDQAAEVERLK